MDMFITKEEPCTLLMHSHYNTHGPMFITNEPMFITKRICSLAKGSMFITKGVCSLRDPCSVPRGHVHYAMVVCRSHGTAGSLAHGVIISRPPGKIQTHWLGHKVVHIVTHNIQKLKSCFHQYFIYMHKFNKTMA